jgi:hypothetical protein
MRAVSLSRLCIASIEESDIKFRPNRPRKRGSAPPVPAFTIRFLQCKRITKTP